MWKFLLFVFLHGSEGLSVFFFFFLFLSQSAYFYLASDCMLLHECYFVAPVLIKILQKESFLEKRKGSVQTTVNYPARFYLCCCCCYCFSRGSINSDLTTTTYVKCLISMPQLHSMLFQTSTTRTCSVKLYQRSLSLQG